jgi:hypothetical protein
MDLMRQLAMLPTRVSAFISPSTGARISYPHAESAEEEFVSRHRRAAAGSTALHPLTPVTASFPAGTGICHTF